SKGYVRDNLVVFTNANERRAEQAVQAATVTAEASALQSVEARATGTDGMSIGVVATGNAAIAAAIAANGGTGKAAAAATARLKGYEGDPCPECANFTMVRNGVCLKCDSCGSTTGCS
ncbi:MAG: hypothetical protein ACKVH1_15960, partial [Alphaproteobacteria bacterium]